METTRGDIPEDQLRKHVIEEEVACGTCVTTQYFAIDGKKVRQDIHVVVDPAKFDSQPGDLGG